MYCKINISSHVLNLFTTIYLSKVLYDSRDIVRRQFKKKGKVTTVTIFTLRSSNQRQRERETERESFKKNQNQLVPFFLIIKIFSIKLKSEFDYLGIQKSVIYDQYQWNICTVYIRIEIDIKNINYIILVWYLIQRWWWMIIPVRIYKKKYSAIIFIILPNFYLILYKIWNKLVEKNMIKYSKTRRDGEDKVTR